MARKNKHRIILGKDGELWCACHRYRGPLIQWIDSNGSLTGEVTCFLSWKKVR